DRRFRSVARMDNRGIVKLGDSQQGLLHVRRVRERQISAANRAVEKDVAAENRRSMTKHHVTRRVAGEARHIKGERADAYDGTVREIDVWLVGLLERNAVDRRLRLTACEQWEICRMHRHRHWPLTTHSRNAPDVIEMAVRQPNRIEGCP